MPDTVRSTGTKPNTTSDKSDKLLVALGAVLAGLSILRSSGVKVDKAIGPATTVVSLIELLTKKTMEDKSFSSWEAGIKTAAADVLSEEVMHPEGLSTLPLLKPSSDIKEFIARKGQMEL